MTVEDDAPGQTLSSSVHHHPSAGGHGTVEASMRGMLTIPANKKETPRWHACLM